MSSQAPVASTLMIGIFGNLLAAEIDRSGGTYARLLVRLAATIWLPTREKARRIEEWEGHLVDAGEEGLRPVLTAWGILLIGGPTLAWTIMRVGRLEAPGDQESHFADLVELIDARPVEDGALIDVRVLEAAFNFMCDRRTQTREQPARDVSEIVSVARICVEMGLDTPAICSALFGELLAVGGSSQAELAARFGDEIGRLAISFATLMPVAFGGHDEQAAIAFRQLILAKAADCRVVAVKLADRLAEMRAIEGVPKQQQVDKARETLDVYVPLAQTLGLKAVQWELEDLAFATLKPHSYRQIKGLVAEGRDEREHYANEMAGQLQHALTEVGIEASFDGLTRHPYSVYSKMTQEGCEFSELYDVTALRVIVDSVKDCYGTVGVIHSLWKPLPGRFKDFIAMPKFNLYQALHTTIIGPHGRPLEIRMQTRDMRAIADFGVVACGWNDFQLAGLRLALLEGTAGEMAWLAPLVGPTTAREGDLDLTDVIREAIDETRVHVLTPKGDVKTMSAGATPLDFAYAIHTEVGHQFLRAVVNGRPTAVDFVLRSGDLVQVETSREGPGPSPAWLSVAATSRARRAIKGWDPESARRTCKARRASRVPGWHRTRHEHL
jgi:guanosine-3',5'-bis(diphosphate) 3'-pyrophosphohydrolase